MTTIKLKDGTADRLHELKDRGDSYDDIVTELLDAREHRLAGAKPTTQPTNDE